MTAHDAHEAHDAHDAHEAHEVRVMTANIRRDLGVWALRPPDRWTVRRDRLRAQLRAFAPHVLGVQEALPGQTRWVLESLGDRYGFVGHGRDADGGGEGCPVFFDRTRLELLGWQQTALSDAPHRAGSRSWGNPFPRVAVTARFRIRGTGAEFRCVNTHLDPVSARSRERSLAHLRDAITAEPGPAILTGDFNTGPGSAALDALLADGALRDAWLVARERDSPEYATYANYRAPRPGRRLDWIVATDDVVVDRVRIVAEPVLGGWPSDHLPVLAEVRLPKGSDPV